jgi:hypothetical protein
MSQIEEETSINNNANKIDPLPIDNNKNEVNKSKVQHQSNKDTVFTLKRWNLVAMWSWDVECETCAICRTPIMGTFFLFLLLL